MIGKRGGTVDLSGLSRSISSSAAFKRAASIAVKKAAAKENAIFTSELYSHKVTQEIEGGPKAGNISGTLGGVGANANLFTFIGFEEGSNPMRPVKTILQQGSFVAAVRPVASATFKTPTVAVSLVVPSLESIQDATPSPWEPGRSWLIGIEEGISGFGHYMYKKFERGRSGFGLQSKHKIRNSSYRPVPYFIDMYTRYLNRLRSL